MKLSYLIIATPVLLAVSVLAVACGGGDDDSTSVPEGPTGIASVDIALADITAHDGDALAQQVVFQSVGCTTADGVGGPPKCEGGEADGTNVDVLPVTSCENAFVREAGVMAQTRDFVIGNNVRVHSVYKHSVPDVLPGDYIILLTYVDQSLGGTRAREMYLNDTGVTGLYFGCSQTVAQLQEDHGLQDPIYTP